MTSRRYRGLATRFAGAALVIATACATAQERTPLSFTAEQADAGKRAYTANCAMRHGPHLSDGATGTPLKGLVFMKKYGGHSLADLFDITRRTMPSGRPGSLEPATYAALTAYILQENAIVPGEVALPSDARQLASMKVPETGFSFMDYSAYAPRKLVTLPNPLDHFTPVGKDDLSNPPPRDWLTWRRGWDAQGFSPLTQITPANATHLQLAWSWTLPAGSTEGVPLVRDGTLFMQAYGEVVQALNAKTGDLLWQYNHVLEPGVAPFHKRGIALWGDKLYFATSDVHVVALDARTGTRVWDTKIGDAQVREGINGGLATRRRHGARRYDGNRSRREARRPSTRRPRRANWRKSAGRSAPSPNPANPAATAGTVSLLNRAVAHLCGHHPATTPKPALLAYFGTGNTYDTGPLLPPKKGPKGTTSDALYTNSTIAVDPATGKIVWYYQHFPNDQWDLDWAFERQLIDLTVGGMKHRAIITSGKIGIYDALDAKTGAFLFSIDLGLNNIVKSIDPKTGQKHVNTALYPGDSKIKMVCPHGAGVKNYLPASWNQQSGILVMPLNEACMDIYPVPGGGGERMSSGANWGIRERPDSDGKYGRLQALDFSTRKPIWTTRSRAPVSSGVLTTAAVTFAATFDRAFHAHDSANRRTVELSVSTTCRAPVPSRSRSTASSTLRSRWARAGPHPQLRAAGAGNTQPVEPGRHDLGVRVALNIPGADSHDDVQRGPDFRCIAAAGRGVPGRALSAKQPRPRAIAPVSKVSRRNTSRACSRTIRRKHRLRRARATRRTPSSCRSLDGLWRTVDSIVVSTVST